MAQTNQYDVAIIGARVAGSAAALMLARLGAKVLLVDRAVLPSPTVSVPIVHAHALSIYEKLGIIDLVEGLGSPQVRRITIKVKGLPGYQVDLQSYKGRDYSLGLRREKLDEVVAHHAAKQPGITLREGFHVSGLLWEDNRVVGLKGRGRKQESEETIRAGLVVGADGAKSLVARETQAKEYNVYQGTTCLYYRYYSGFNYLDPNRAYIYRNLDEGFALLVFPADNGTVAITCGIDQAQFSEARKDATSVLERHWKSVALIREMGRQAEPITPTMGYAPHPYYYRRPWGAGWALIGDAGYLKDPVAGQGVYDALHSAELLTAAWAEVQQGRPYAEAMKEYQRTRDEETRTIYRLTYNVSRLEKPSPVENFLGQQVVRAFARDRNLANYFSVALNGQVDFDNHFSPTSIATQVAKSYVRTAPKVFFQRVARVSTRLAQVADSF